MKNTIGPFNILILVIIKVITISIIDYDMKCIQGLYD